MKIAGIIAEYNPFHTGHAYHIQKTRELTGADYIVVVMSGDFVQSGSTRLVFQASAHPDGTSRRCGSGLRTAVNPCLRECRILCTECRRTS